MSLEPHASREPWNKGKLVGQKAPLKLKDIWAIRVRLQLMQRTKELALFDLGIDSKLRGCDLVKLRVRDVCHGSSVASRAIVMQQKTQRPVQFEITEPTRAAITGWMKQAALRSVPKIFCFRVGCIAQYTCRLANTPVSSMTGLMRLVLIRPTMARTP